MMLTYEQAKARGMAVDATCYPWVAYRGSRFQPTEVAECYTARETDLLQQVQTLTAELENLRSGRKFDYHVPTEWNLTPVEVEVFLQLVKREVVSTEAFMASVWSDRDVEPATVRRLVHYVRSKLAPFGVKVRNSYGQGWFIENRAGVKAMLRAGGTALQ